MPRLTPFNGAGEPHPFHPHFGCPFIGLNQKVRRARLWHNIRQELGWSNDALHARIAAIVDHERKIAAERVRRQQRAAERERDLAFCPRGGGHWAPLSELDSQGRYCKQCRREYLREHRRKVAERSVRRYAEAA
jgi:hypothetical protein